MDHVLLEKVKTATTVHEDLRKVESINNWVEDQCGRASVMDTSRIVSAFESDRTG